MISTTTTTLSFADPHECVYDPCYQGRQEVICFNFTHFKIVSTVSSLAWGGGNTNWDKVRIRKHNSISSSPRSWNQEPQFYPIRSDQIFLWTQIFKHSLSSETFIFHFQDSRSIWHEWSALLFFHCKVSCGQIMSEWYYHITWLWTTFRDWENISMRDVLFRIFITMLSPSSSYS